MSQAKPKRGRKPIDESLRRTHPVRTFHTPADIEVIGGPDKARNIAEAAIVEAVKKANGEKAK